MNNYEAIIVGAGIMGSAAAYHLANRGRRVLLLEQFAIGHERGSSHGHSRIFRLAYDTAEYVELARMAAPLWRTLEQDSGTDLLLQTGGLTFADPPDHEIVQMMATLDATGIAYERLTGRQIRERFPQFVVSDDALGYFQADTGILHATNCVQTLVAQARRYGAVVNDQTLVQSIQPAAGGVEVTTSNGRFTGDRLIVTAGSWARPLLQQLGLELPLTVTKEQFAFFTPHQPALFQPERCPVFIQHMPAGPSVYGFPIYGLPGVKAAFHHAGPVLEPDQNDQSVEPEALAALHQHMARWMPQAAAAILHAQTCRYTSTPDQEFLIDQHPGYPQIMIGSPCSGHGFKFGIAIGAILADLAEYGTSRHPIDRFSFASRLPSL